MPPALNKHKIQRWSPDTCDPILEQVEIFDAIGDPFDPPQFRDASKGGCVLLQYWDSLDPATPPVVVGYDQICPAHEVPTDAGAGKLKWHTGNWKDKGALIAEQREWFLWLNHKEWLAKGRLVSDMPDQIKTKTVEPVTPTTLTAPTKTELDDLDQVALWNTTDNARVGIAKQIINTELSKEAGSEDTTVWSYSGKGDARVLTITDKDGLTAGQLSKVEGAMDIQFGTGKVVVG